MSASSMIWSSAKWLPAPMVPRETSHSSLALLELFPSSLSHASRSDCVRQAPSNPRSFSAILRPLSPSTWLRERVVLYQAMPQPMSPPIRGG